MLHTYPPTKVAHPATLRKRGGRRLTATPTVPRDDLTVTLAQEHVARFPCLRYSAKHAHDHTKQTTKQQTTNTHTPMAPKVNFPNHASGIYNKIDAALQENTSFRNVQQDPATDKALSYIDAVLRSARQQVKDLQNGNPMRRDTAQDLMNIAARFMQDACQD